MHFVSGIIRVYVKNDVAEFDRVCLYLGILRLLPALRGAFGPIGH